jgi:adenine-specific DNA-methyltransferase
LPEETEPSTEAYKAGYKTICEIGKERIRRAGKKISEEQNQIKTNGSLFDNADAKPKVDIGFRVLKLDSSNMNDIYYRPEEFSDQLIKEDNVKEDRTPLDLLFQVMLECNLPLSAKIKTEEIAGKEVFSVNNGYLVACFDEDINEDVIKAVAKLKPYYFVMRDSSLASDNVADNFEQIFQAYSKETIRRIL